ncbi:MAG: hypothetical protein HOH77_00715 [Candidatus Latescibacteria bacterium]|nr:hypothetical protein [Candidatus Latescibacterota bacterium]
MVHRHLFWLLALFFLYTPPGFAQEYFGKNKVNYSQYEWHYIDSEHFIVYFDKGSLELAEFVAKEAERSLVHIEKTIKYTMKNRYPIVIYNSHNGFSVTNITASEQSEFTGGFTEFAQGRVVIPYTGSYADLRHVIHHELVHAVTIELWTGGGWLGSLVSQTATLPPLWIAEGIAEYVSRYGWHKEHDNFMRDATITGYVPPIEIMSYSYFAYPGGGSVFYMIEQEYGNDKVAEFISAFRTAKTPDKALKASLGFGLKELNEKYQLWLKRQYWNEINLHSTPTEIAKNLTDREEGRSTYNLAAAFSPQGDKVAYLTDRNGTFDIYLMSAIDGKDLGRLVEGQKSSNFESMFVLRPGFTWSPDGRSIAFAAKSNNKNTLYVLDVKKKKVRKRFKFELDGLFEPTWSPDGQKIAVAGIKDGWSDIYVVDINDESLTRVTHDPYDERHLDWSPDGQWIAMSSDRPDTSLTFTAGKDFPFGQYDIFVIQADGSELRRVVADEVAEESHPVWGPDSKQLAFVSDRTGMGNIFIANLDSAGVYPITNLLSGAQYLDWSTDGRKIVFNAFHKGALDVFVLKDPLDKRKEIADLPRTLFVKRLEGVDTKTFVERQREKYAPAKTTGEDSDIEVTVTDSTAEDDMAVWISDQAELAAAEAEVQTTTDTMSIATTYPLEGSPEEAGKDDSGFRDWGEKEFQVKKYKLKFKPELFGAQAGFDTFYGVSSFITLSASDVMGDHRAQLLTSLNFSLKDSDFLLSYAFLKRRNNYFSQLFHTRFYFFNNNVLHADRYYGLAAGVERPFNRFSRLELNTRAVAIDRERLGATAGGNFNPGFQGVGNGFNGVLIDRQKSVIAEAALVGDSALYSLFGAVDGKRYRFHVEGSTLGMKFITTTMDYRKYLHLSDQYTFAFRLSGGTSYGQNSTVFFLGGVNNPINPTFSTIASVDQNRIFFSSYVWPLRGADLLEMAGDSYTLANIAFRFPLIHQLAMGWPLPFFFQNIQGELFLDVGGAFNRDSVEFWEARDGGFELRDLQAGYGFGVRANMGYFLFRYDLAWPTDFAQTFHPKQYFSIDYTGLF